MWKLRYERLVHEVKNQLGTPEPDTAGCRVVLRCGVEMYYTLPMGVPFPDEVLTTCIGCIVR